MIAKRALFVIFLSLTISASARAAQWSIVLGNHCQPPEQTAAQIVADAMKAGGMSAAIVSETQDGWQAGPAILLGTPQTSRTIASLIGGKAIDLPHMDHPSVQDDSYLVQSLESPRRIVLASALSRGVLYAACDLEKNLDLLDDLNIRMVPRVDLRIVTLPIELTDKDPHVVGGPWSDFKAEPDNFRRFLKWCAQNRYNCVLGGASAYFPPMSFIDYSKTPYPEAQQYSADKVEENRARFRANAKLIHQYGLDVIINNFTLLAPKNYLRAHPEMQTEFLSKHDSGMETDLDYVGNLSWNDPNYKKFWIYSYTEMMKELPELNGLLMAYAEWIYNNDANMKRRGFVATAIDFINSAEEVVKQTRGPAGIFIQRDWYLVTENRTVTYIGPNHNVFLDPTCPRVPISFKVAGFDAATTTPDPWIANYTKLGYGAVAWIRMTDTENTRPLWWSDVDFYHDMFDDLMRLGCTGFSMSSPLEQLERSDDRGQFPMIDAVTHYLWGQDYTDKDAINDLVQWYGPAAPHVYLALQHCAHVMTQYPKLATGEYGGGDGISTHAVCLGTLPMIPKIWPHVQRDAVGIVEYADYVKQDAVGRAKIEAQWRADRRIAPPALLDQFCQEAASALAEARQAKALSPKAPDIDRIVENCIIVNHLAQAYRYHMMGALEFVVSGGDLAQPKNPPGPALLNRAKQACDDWENAFTQIAIVAKATNDLIVTDPSKMQIREEVYKFPLRDYDNALQSMGLQMPVPKEPDLPAGCIWIEGESFQKTKGWKVSNFDRTTLFGGEALVNEGGGEKASTEFAAPDGQYVVWARALSDKSMDMSFIVSLKAGAKSVRGTVGTARPYRKAYRWSKVGELQVEGGSVSVELSLKKSRQVGLDALVLVPAGVQFEPEEARTALEPSQNEADALILAEFAAKQPLPAMATAGSEAANLCDKTLLK